MLMASAADPIKTLHTILSSRILNVGSGSLARMRVAFETLAAALVGALQTSTNIALWHQLLALQTLYKFRGSGFGLLAMKIWQAYLEKLT